MKKPFKSKHKNYNRFMIFAFCPRQFGWNTLLIVFFVSSDFYAAFKNLYNVQFVHFEFSRTNQKKKNEKIQNGLR